MAKILSITTVGGKWVIHLDSSPKVGSGVQAPQGSVSLVGDAISGQMFLKYGALATEWQDISEGGAVGPVGPQGPQGESAYEVAVSEGFVGTEAEWLASLVGPQGDKGETGAIGPQGDVGPIGPAGPQGEQGETGPMGPQGEKGDKGDKGDTGDTGVVSATSPLSYNSLTKTVSISQSTVATDGYLSSTDFNTFVNKASTAYVDSKVEDAIVDGVTTKAPSQNAVFDALAVIKNFAIEQTVFVAKGGNDSTGNGSQLNPYLTITKALTSITDATPTKRYVILVSAGNYSEASLAIKSNIFIIGESKESVRITGAVSMGAWTQDNSGSDDRSGFSMLTLLSSADFNWSTAKSRAGKLYFNEVVLGSTLNMYGYDNAIAQAQFDSCIIFGAMTVSGINVGVYSNNINYGNITLNQHPNGGMATILSTSGGKCDGTVTLNATTDNFGRRCSLFAKNFYMEYVTVNGVSAYADMNDASLPRSRDRIISTNNGNLVSISTKAPLVTNAQNIGELTYQYLYTFSYVFSSTQTDLYVISMDNAYGPSNNGRSIFVEADSYGLNSNINGGDITLSTAVTSGTGVRGKISLNAREIDANSTKIINVADGVNPNDAVNVSQLSALAQYVVMYDSRDLFPVTGSDNVVYVSKATNVLYRWDTVESVYTEISDSLVTRVFNNSGGPLSKMQAVYLNGVQGDRPTIALAQADSESSSSKTFGLLVDDVVNMEDQLVISAGRLQYLNTNVVGWNEGDSLWLSPTVAGGITNVKPSAPDHAVFIGTLVRKHTNQGVIEVRIQNGYELQELHNVEISSPQPNQILRYDNVSSTWKNSDETEFKPSFSDSATGLTIDNTGITVSFTRPLGAFSATDLVHTKITIGVYGTIDSNVSTASFVFDIHTFNGVTYTQQNSFTSVDTNASVGNPTCSNLVYNSGDYDLTFSTLVSGKSMTGAKVKVFIEEDIMDMA